MAQDVLANLSMLVLEDEVLLRKQIVAELERYHVEVTSAATVENARRYLADLEFDLVLLDVNLPDGLGTDLLREAKIPSGTAVVVMTAQGGVGGAVEAFKLGAVDYLVKPFELAELPLVLSRARRSKTSDRLNEHRQRKQQTRFNDFFFGNSLKDLQAYLEKILAADRRLQGALPPVLIEGETGTGKTTIARWIHQSGPRSQKPFVEVNCSALPETLAESELFGHEKGAFTDAKAARIGLFEAAHEGTLFLDELSSLPLPLQAKLLKVLEDQKLRRVGGTREVQVDVRIIAAANQDLNQMVTAGTFREDLLHRLDLFRLRVPPLRERGDDTVRLGEHLLAALCRKHRLPARKISGVGRNKLKNHGWPGNVRELAHELERALVFEEGPEVDLALLRTSSEAQLQRADWFNGSYRFPESGFSLDAAILRLIRHALQQTDDNVSAAARLLGVSRDYVRYHLDRKPESGEATGG
jgi:DNA-binding NtrC family response regulator